MTDSKQNGSHWYVGRERELGMLRSCAQDVRGGRPRVALVQGVAGIGKSSLLGRFVAELDGFVALRAACDSSETEFAFAVVSQLLSRIPQRLRAAHPLLSGMVPANASIFEVAVQFRALLADLTAGGRRPVALTVDDVQWADPESVRCLGSVLRRLAGDPVLTVLTARSEETGESTGCLDQDDGYARLLAVDVTPCRIRLAGLSVGEVATLAARLGFPPVSGQVAGRLHRHTGGHPLLVHTVLAGLPHESLIDLSRPLPVPGSVREGVLRRLSGLPADSRRLLDALAVLDLRCSLAMLAEVAGTTDAARALGPLTGAGLVRCWQAEPPTPVEIHHPMHRNAVYEAMDPVRRRELHAAAARAVDSAVRWPHLVAAVDRSDPRLATDLEQAAADAIAVADVDRAATYLLWAADICGNQAEHERLLLTAVSHLLVWQKHRRVAPLYEAIMSCAPSPLRSCLLGQWATSRGEFGVAEDHFAAAIQATERDPAQSGVAARAYSRLAAMHLWRGDGERVTSAAERALQLGGLDAAMLPATKFFVASGRLFTEGPVAALGKLEELTDLPAEPADTPPADLFPLTWRGAWRVLAGQLTAGLHDLDAVIRLGRRGVPTQIPEYAHVWRSHGRYLVGDWDGAAIDAERAVSITMTDEKAWVFAQTHAAAAMVAAGRGDWEQATELVGATERFVGTFGPPQFVLYSALAAGSLAQARGDHDAMLAAVRPLLDVLDRYPWFKGYRRWWLPPAIEAMIGAGRLDAAATALDELAGLSRTEPGLDLVTGWLTGWLCERRGDLAAARERYQAALAAPVQPDDVPLQRARLEHAMGHLLLVRRERRLAIDWLRRAHDRYAGLGARPFTERCLADLVACGLHPPKHGADALRLTGRERDVAHLVARGLTNEEAAKELFVSVKTIEYHLGNIYAKLGCNSRHDLAPLLAAQP